MMAEDVEIFPPLILKKERLLNIMLNLSRKSYNCLLDIMWLLNNMGYVEVGNARDVVKCIEDNHLDAFMFDFPDNMDYSEFKDKVLAGEYDIPETRVTDEKRARLDAAVKAGKMKRL